MRIQLNEGEGGPGRGASEGEGLGGGGEVRGGRGTLERPWPCSAGAKASSIAIIHAPTSLPALCYYRTYELYDEVCSTDHVHGPQ